MVYKGAVVEVKENYIVVFTNDCKYNRLKKKRDVKIGKEIIFIEDDIIKEKNNYYKRVGTIAAAVILLISILFSQIGTNIFENTNAYAVISLDINPSLEFRIDSNKRVKSIEVLNEDGKDIIDDTMINKDIQDVIRLCIDNAIDKRYITEENNIILISNVYLQNKDDSKKTDNEVGINIQEEIIEEMEKDKAIQDREISILYIESNKETLKEANKNKITVGKYEVYKTLSQNNKNISIDEVKESKVSEIVKENVSLMKEEKIKIKELKKVEEKKKEIKEIIDNTNSKKENLIRKEKEENKNSKNKKNDNKKNDNKKNDNKKNDNKKNDDESKVKSNEKSQKKIISQLM